MFFFHQRHVQMWTIRMAEASCTVGSGLPKSVNLQGQVYIYKPCCVHRSLNRVWSTVAPGLYFYAVHFSQLLTIYCLGCVSGRLVQRHSECDARNATTKQARGSLLDFFLLPVLIRIGSTVLVHRVSGTFEVYVIILS